jgi:hypothetical protein
LNNPVQYREGWIEHPLPGEAGEHRRHDERQKNERANEALEFEIAIEQEREPEAQDQFEHCRDERIEERVVDDGVENRVFQ